MEEQVTPGEMWVTELEFGKPEGKIDTFLLVYMHRCHFPEMDFEEMVKDVMARFA